MTRKEMTNERAQSDVRINSAERGGIGRSQIGHLRCSSMRLRARTW